MLTNKYWNCARCNMCMEKITTECTGCKYRDALYRNKTNLGQYMGQCKRCERLGPASLPCHYCWRLNKNNLRQFKQQLHTNLTNTDGEIELHKKFGNGYFCRETGVNSTDYDTQHTNHVYNEHTAKIIPHQTIDWINFRNFVYVHDVLERIYETEVHKIVGERYPYVNVREIRTFQCLNDHCGLGPYFEKCTTCNMPPPVYQNIRNLEVGTPV
jgi:hypothetical protein